jgi:hypothetical protein
MASSGGVRCLKEMGACSLPHPGAPDAVAQDNGLRVGTSALNLVPSPICEI